jgi:acyl-CoA synthetase (AMP-forming)/AMP-acid ligase II
LAERLDMHRAEASLLIAGGDRHADCTMPRGQKIIDLTTLGELALIARRRLDHSTRDGLPIGVVGAPSDTELAPLLVETRIKAVPQRAGDVVRGGAVSGEMTVRGPMVPEFIWGAGGRPEPLGEPDGWTSTGLSVQVTSVQPPLFDMRGVSGEIMGQGALAIDLIELDRLYQSIEGVSDAAAVPYPDAGSARVAAVVVPSPGWPFNRAAYIAGLEAARIGLHKLPVEVFPVPSIARTATERVMRTGMATRLANLAASERK